MPAYKLTYFDIRGRGEISRYLFAAAGIKFEDCRVSQEDWPKVKETVPRGQLPVLDIDGKQRLSQSMAIARFLATSFGLDGKTNWDKGVINEVLDTIVDFKDAYYKNFFETDAAKKAETEKKFKTESIPRLLDYLENTIKNNGNKSGFLVGDSPTVGDFMILDIVELILSAEKDCLEKRLLLKANHEKVTSSPRIKAYRESRPKRDF